MRKGESILKHLDWSIVLLYVILVIMGWFNIFASVYDPESASNIFDLSLNSGRQLLFIGGAVFLIIIILLLDFRIYESFAPALYILFLCLLIGVLVFGTKINGARAWFDLGIFRFQPAEFTKLATALLLARYISTTGVKLNEFKHQLIVLAMIALPVGLILLQPDTGSAMVFAALIIPLYREGFPSSYLVLGLTAAGLFILTLLLPQIYIIIGLAVLAAIAIALTEKTKGRIILIIVGAILCVGFVFTTDYLLNNVLKGYQKSRIEAIFRPELVNPKAEGWNLEQSKIAIGSGGFAGKGFLEGTQTKYGYVPEQSTDFIFSTLAEEHGWIGSAVVIVLFLILMIRIISIAERQKFKFARFYGYAVASILFFHFTINIAMTIGLFPVVGIPLPFFSYGGSSLWSFTVMLFVLLKMDMHRSQVLTR